MPGQKARIARFTDEEIGQKLLEMGCVPQSELHMLRPAPLGDPLAFECEGSIISIRKAEAQNVVVERL